MGSPWVTTWGWVLFHSKIWEDQASCDHTKCWPSQNEDNSCPFDDEAPPLIELGDDSDTEVIEYQEGDSSDKKVPEIQAGTSFSKQQGLKSSEDQKISD